MFQRRAASPPAVLPAMDAADTYGFAEGQVLYTEDDEANDGLPSATGDLYFAVDERADESLHMLAAPVPYPWIPTPKHAKRKRQNHLTISVHTESSSSDHESPRTIAPTRLEALMAPVLPPQPVVAKERRHDTLLARVRNKILSRQAEDSSRLRQSLDRDYLAPDTSDSGEDTLALVAPLLLPPPASSSDKIRMAPVLHDPRHRQLKAKPPTCDSPEPPRPLPDPPTSFFLPFVHVVPVKRVLPPAMAHGGATKKSNPRTIYNCVKCGRMKRAHMCAFPDNVRSMGTTMLATTTPRDHLSRYYKCGRVLSNE
ncbi:hypothetical protein SPRG_01038 [Saprolegnia parasitica CBS 223.65]|uniref:Uncharacterized protein n=1 Tax=Saprolegnia parasitica (strain CBS 223.65) TaxID=695850 RepID=A0A067D8J1_SAPPC|nr:hypothetical protein SPRG_01038 [Saprolegnia parasitica CBS 223.65]KDO34976.1 hypothetical protein SPRG_01038 [Saprolegnia parasitica CBS 223.65]|eukprot:XP_012194630.1 hypothetical protein SPRG_01038 [Saprolegnia parasitica CBS 223.65]